MQNWGCRFSILLQNVIAFVNSGFVMFISITCKFKWFCQHLHHTFISLQLINLIMYKAFYSNRALEVFHYLPTIRKSPDFNFDWEQRWFNITEQTCQWPGKNGHVSIMHPYSCIHDPSKTQCFMPSWSYFIIIAKKTCSTW